MRTRLAPLLAAFLLQAGCGLQIGQGPRPGGPGPLFEPLQEEPTHTFVFVGEVRDFATFRPEPDAVIEFWSERSSYTPIVNLDGRGGFSVRVDGCRRPIGLGDQVIGQVLTGYTGNCQEDIGRFGLRARKGERCSLPVEGAPQARPGPSILWLRDCTLPIHADHDWRPALQATDAPAPG